MKINLSPLMRGGRFMQFSKYGKLNLQGSKYDII
jgi:hypothetical protein